MYENHIKYIKNFQAKFKKSFPYKFNSNYRPFGNKIPLEIQESILNIKYIQEKKYWERYLFLISHTNPLIDYLEKKKDWAENGLY